jgi:hypothetical protein
MAPSPPGGKAAGLRSPCPRRACGRPQTPLLYTLETAVLVDGQEVDRVETRFGIRTLPSTARAALPSTASR